MGFVIWYLVLLTINIFVIYIVHKDRKKYPNNPSPPFPYWMWFTIFYTMLAVGLFNLYFFAFVYE